MHVPFTILLYFFPLLLFSSCSCVDTLYLLLSLCGCLFFSPSVFLSIFGPRCINYWQILHGLSGWRAINMSLWFIILHLNIHLWHSQARKKIQLQCDWEMQNAYTQGDLGKQRKILSHALYHMDNKKTTKFYKLVWIIFY